MNGSLSYVTGYAPGCNTSIGDRLTVVILFHHGLHDRLLGLCLFAAVDTLLHVPQLVVLAFLGKQLIVRAAFHDLAVVHHKDHSHERWTGGELRSAWNDLQADRRSC